MAIYYLMSYVVPADIAQVDEIETGEARAGIYTGFIGVPLNMFQAASSLLLGAFMDFSVVLTGGDLWGLMWWGPVFAGIVSSAPFSSAKKGRPGVNRTFLLIAAALLHYVDIDPDFDARAGKTRSTESNE